MLPIALMPKELAARTWLVFEVVCAVFLLAFAFFVGYGTDRCVWRGWFSLVLGTCATVSVADCLTCLNFGLPIAVVAVLMCICLDRGLDASAGVCWALMMVKPQIALVFAIPLLFERKFKTVFVAAIVCFGAAIVPAALCGRNPIEMILGLRNCGTEFPQLGTIRSLLLPDVVLGRLWLDSKMILCANGIVGIVFCIALTAIWRRTGSWLWKFLPAMALSFCWTVNTPITEV